MPEIVRPGHGDPRLELGQHVAIKFLGLIVWKYRKTLPNLELELTLEDMAHFNTAMSLQGVRPIVQCRSTARGVIVRLADESGMKEIQNPPDGGDEALTALNKARDDVTGLVKELAALAADSAEAPATLSLAVRCSAALMLLAGVEEQRNNVPKLFHPDKGDLPKTRVCPDGHLCTNDCPPGECVRQITGDMVRH